MRDLGEARTRWAEVVKHKSLAELQRATRYNGSSSPCVAGHRSLCWKIFLLFESASPADWTDSLSSGRKAYTEWSERFLRFTKHPEELSSVAADPLADDPNSPWNTVRQDEVVRGEIAQDVQRLPDEPFYHEESTQTMIIDALFVYCKLHPEDGGYRQGMHELLAPIVHVLHQDALDRQGTTPETPEDEIMIDVLDAAYIEHDAFALFSKIMERAKAFYEVKESTSQSALESASRGQTETSAIVEKSRFIHETCLAKVDPELSRHLKEVEILPQIFLIRWIRLLLGREFPFDQLLVLWDALFAVDPTLDLVDYICVAMLVRIRWSLLEADYSHCLQLLLKYPAPSEHHGPHTFVDDAVYLKDHLDTSGGASLVVKYTGRLPADAPSVQNRPRRDSRLGKGSPTRPRVSRSPLASPGKFIQQQGGMEAIFQGAARNVLERGEKLGINQAVRDAVGEIKRNVQGFNEARLSPATGRQAFASESATKAIAALERRNVLLASMLDESIVNLKAIANSDLDDKTKTVELVEAVAAKVQFVKVHLEDSTISVADQEAADPLGQEEAPNAGKAENEKGDAATMAAVAADVEADGIPSLKVTDKTTEAPVVKTTAASPPASEAKMTDAPKETVLYPPPGISKDTSSQQTDGTVETKEKRPQPIPTRSTLAQSSFSWMLEPDETSPTTRPQQLSSGGPSRGKGSTRSKRNSGNVNRERNAFLFGEPASESDGAHNPATEDIFGMEPIREKKDRKELF